MRRRLVLAVAFVSLFAAGSRAIAEDGACRPTVLITGAPALTEDIQIALEQRGIAFVQADGCPSVKVRIEAATTGLAVSIEDPDGRRSDRVVGDAATAAAWIDSWAHPDLGAGALVHGATSADKPAFVARDTEIPAVLEQVIIHQAQPQAISVAARTTASVANDRSIWAGIDVGACVQIGSVCAGAVVRTRLDTATVGASEHYETRRTAVDLLVGAELSYTRGTTHLHPGAGVGLGWVRSHSSPDLVTPGQQIDVDAGGIRIGAYVTASRPIGRRLFLDLDLAVDISLLAHTSTYLDEGVTLAGEPRGFLRAGIGLRYGAP